MTFTLKISHMENLGPASGQQSTPENWILGEQFIRTIEAGKYSVPISGPPALGCSAMTEAITLGIPGGLALLSVAEAILPDSLANLSLIDRAVGLKTALENLGIDTVVMHNTAAAHLCGCRFYDILPLIVQFITLNPIVVNVSYRNQVLTGIGKLLAAQTNSIDLLATLETHTIYLVEQQEPESKFVLINGITDHTIDRSAFPFATHSCLIYDEALLRNVLGTLLPGDTARADAWFYTLEALIKAFWCLKFGPRMLVVQLSTR